MHWLVVKQNRWPGRVIKHEHVLQVRTPADCVAWRYLRCVLEANLCICTRTRCGTMPVMRRRTWCLRLRLGYVCAHSRIVQCVTPSAGDAQPHLAYVLEVGVERCQVLFATAAAAHDPGIQLSQPFRNKAHVAGAAAVGPKQQLVEHLHT